MVVHHRLLHRMQRTILATQMLDGHDMRPMEAPDKPDARCH